MRAVFVFLPLFLTSCVTTPDMSPGDQPIQRVFVGTYDQVWKATQRALVKYPIRVNNSDTGTLQTDHVRGPHAYRPPHSQESYSSGYRHRITLRVVRGRLQGREAAQVTVTKSPEIQKDFFSNPSPTGSDGIEERVILYRIQRELDLDRKLNAQSS